MYNKSNIKQYKFRTKCIGDLKVERVSGCFSLKQVIVIGLDNFNITEADTFSDPHDSCHFSVYILYLIYILALLYVYISSNIQTQA